jgi:hypothetical protein
MFVLLLVFEFEVFSNQEIWLLADWLYKHPSGLSEPELFLQRGIPDEMIAVREALDTGKKEEKTHLILFF